jgi:hypothetical protein
MTEQSEEQPDRQTTERTNGFWPRVRREWPHAGRILILGVVSVLVVIGLVLIVMAIGEEEVAERGERVNALATSDNECVTCHRRTTPGIVQQYSFSTMAAAEVSCMDCHGVDKDYPGAIAHQDTFVLNSPTPKKCETCHAVEVKEFGAWLHVQDNLIAGGTFVAERFIRGAPFLAPLLFANAGFFGLLVLLDPRSEVLEAEE